MCFGADDGETLDVLLQEGNARLPNPLIKLLCCLMIVLFCVLVVV